jgi:hypothetical protein
MPKVFRSRKAKKDWQHNDQKKRSKGQEEFEDNTGVITSRKSKKDKQYNDQKKKEKRTNNDKQSITQKI